MVNVKDLSKLGEEYNTYVAQLNRLSKLYLQGVPVVVSSTTSIPTQPVPSTIPDPTYPSQCLQIVPSSSSVPVDSQNWYQGKME